MNSIRVLSRIFRPTTSLFSCQKTSFSTSKVNSSVYPPDWAEPDPDREFYRKNPPEDGDAMSFTNVKPAPTRHYYSIFHDPMLERFEKHVLKQGKGELATKFMKETFAIIKAIQVKKYHSSPDELKEEIEVNPLVIFHQAMRNGMPIVSIQSVTKAGATFKVPVAVTERKGFFMATKWILNHCRSGKPNTPLSARLAREILAAYNNDGVMVKNKKDLHREAEVNRAYAHYKWQ